MGIRAETGVNDLYTYCVKNNLQYLLEQWDYSKNGEFTPKNITSRSNRKFWWKYQYNDPASGKCFEFEWESTPNNRIRNNSICPFISSGGKTQLYKGFNDLATQFPELIKEWHPTKNGDIKPSEILPQSSINVWWFLPYDDPRTGKHFDFEWQTPLQNRTVRNYGCPFLNNSKVWKGYNDLKTLYPEIAQEWHPTKNENLKPDEVLYGSNQKVWWYLPYDDPRTGKHFNFEWVAPIIDRTARKLGCPFLTSHQVFEGFNDLATLKPELAAEWNYEKNGLLIPENVTQSSGKKVWWKCKQGHEWQAVITSRSNGNGCPFCSRLRTLKGYNDLATLYPELAKEWHPTKNGHLKPTDISVSNSKKVWWLGKCGHEWQAVVGNRTKGVGCPICAGQLVQPGINDLATTNPELVDEWDFSKNHGLTPAMVMHGTEKKVWWICKKGHSWKAYISPRTKGVGCPICSSERNTSFPEFAIMYYLSQVEDNVIHSYKDLGFEVDIYIPSKKIGIEYDGAFWHRNKQKKDKEKNKNCSDNGITLYRFRENELGSLNDSSIDIICYEKEFPQKLTELIEKLYHTILDIDLDRDFAKINEYREFKEKENSLVVMNPELAAEWNYERNGKLKPEHVTRSSGKKVWWIGKCGHEWMAVVSSRVMGNGCPYCSNKLPIKGYNELKTIYPDIADEWNYEKNTGRTDKRGNDISQPDNVLSKSHYKVWWIGKCGHEWQAVISTRTSQNTGCPICAGKQILKGYNDLATINPKIASEWNYDKNGSLTPDMVSSGSELKVWWTCRKCQNEYTRTIVGRTSRGYGCPVCGKNNSAKAKYKKVKNLDTGEVFNSIKAAAEYYNLGSHHNIGLACKGIRNKAGGFRWAYIE